MMPLPCTVLAVFALVCTTHAFEDGSPRAHRLSVSSSSSQQRSAEIRRAPPSVPSLPMPNGLMPHMQPMALPQLFPQIPSMVPNVGPKIASSVVSAKKRKPAPVDDGTPKAKALKSEVRKSPQKPANELPPLGGAFPMQPMQMHQLHSLPTLPPPVSVSLPTLATVSFPTISMPTFPTFTMPPPFSALVSTKKPKKSSKRRKSTHKKKSRKQPISEEDELTSVGSRMPKYVKHDKSSTGTENDTPSWMVPYKNKL